MCRRELADSYFEAPDLLEEISSDEVALYENSYQWFYEGRNGWWLYDKRASDDIEAAFKEGSPKCELLIAGYLYVIDFEKMMQYRRNEPLRQRHVKRDIPDSNQTKGIAGLRRTITVENSGSDTACAPSPQVTIAPQQRIPSATNNSRSLLRESQPGISPQPSVRARRSAPTQSASVSTATTSTRSIPAAVVELPSNDVDNITERLEGTVLRPGGYHETYL